MKLRLLFIWLILASLTAPAQDINVIVGGLKSDQQVVDTLFYFGRRYIMRGKNDSALIWIDKGLETAKKMSNPEWIARFYIEKSNVLLNSDKKKTLETLKLADPYMEQAKDYRIWQKYYMITAKCYKHLLKHDFALEYFMRCENLNNEHNPYLNWLVYIELGEMFDDADAVTEAQKYYEKGYTLTKSRAVRMDHGLMLSELANFYSRRNKPEQFAGLFKEYQAFLASGKKPSGDDSFHNMLFIDWGDTPLEEQVGFMKKVADRLLKNGDFTNATYANHNIAVLYEKDGQVEKALQYMRLCVEISRRDDDLQTIYAYTGGIYRLLKKAGKDNEAIRVVDEMFIIKDSILKRQQRDIVLELETKYQTEKKEKEITILSTKDELNKKEIALLNSQNTLNTIRLLRNTEQREALLRENNLYDSVLEQGRINNELLFRENTLKNSELEKGQALAASINRENKMKAAELSRGKKFQSILIAGAVLLMAAGFFILILYARQRKKNLLIQKQSADLQVLLKEIHHRVKNNLQIISSLLDLQSMSIKDNQASEAVKESKNRVYSMALIHQNLYSEDNLKLIRARQYIDNLLQSLCDSYSISKERVRLLSDIDDISLDVDTMIPLGLILNELVSNALKYAFCDKETGELQIVLRREPEHLFLKVKDNGAGFPEGIDAKNGRSFGLRMIRAFAQKLKAKLEIYNQDGAVVEMQIAKFNMA